MGRCLNGRENNETREKTAQFQKKQLEAQELCCPASQDGRYDSHKEIVIRR